MNALFERVALLILAIFASAITFLLYTRVENCQSCVHGEQVAGYAICIGAALGIIVIMNEAVRMK